MYGATGRRPGGAGGRSCGSDYPSTVRRGRAGALLRHSLHPALRRGSGLGPPAKGASGGTYHRTKRVRDGKDPGPLRAVEPVGERLLAPRHPRDRALVLLPGQLLKEKHYLAATSPARKPRFITKWIISASPNPFGPPELRVDRRRVPPSTAQCSSAHHRLSSERHTGGLQLLGCVGGYLAVGRHRGEQLLLRPLEQSDLMLPGRGGGQEYRGLT